ncbi:hypothetical protein [Chitinophaga sp. 212800010-3]|uniref:hypothetical protein n=1 Tax=unclassified Chitinophaga TaxID=2619133 RepID=UPI002DF646FC|nr:hypothetical protein [Chitinophaga sp. 212800010-3]
MTQVQLRKFVGPTAILFSLCACSRHNSQLSPMAHAESYAIQADGTSAGSGFDCFNQFFKSLKPTPVNA